MKYFKKILIPLCVCLPMLSYAFEPSPFSAENLTIRDSMVVQGSGPTSLNYGVVTLRPGAKWIFKSPAQVNIQQLTSLGDTTIEFDHEAVINAQNIEGHINIVANDKKQRVLFYYAHKSPGTSIKVNGDGTVKVRKMD